MFPNNQFYTTVTLYTPLHDLPAREARFYRRVLRKCFWNADSLTVTRSGGTAAAEQVHLEIPLKYNGGYGKRRGGALVSGYVNRDDWLKLPKEDAERFWSILNGGDVTNKSMLMQGDVQFPELETWQSTSRLGQAYTAIVREHGRLLRFPVNLDEMLIGFPADYKVNCAC